MSSIDSLLSVARAYGAAERIDLSTVSWRALGDTKKLPAIVAGKDIQVRRFERAMQWFSDHWPDGADWPETVARPERSDALAQRSDTGSTSCPAQ
ncbi:MAG: hypothetical protein WC026_16895 [Hyphomicrobium sp.]|uniref:hypothetical protein n=1 Tax=Hyphomicrobium sp. TaxID=82 RepID=UPI0035631389